MNVDQLNKDKQYYQYNQGSTLYFVGELMSLSHSVFPGPQVIRVGDTMTDSEWKQLEMSDINSDLELISTGVYQKIVHIPNVQIVKVISGRHHTHLLTFEGRILSFGANPSGELCCGRTGSIHQSYATIKGLIHAEGIVNEYKIIDGSGGGYHTLFLSSDGSVFVNGSNNVNQLGFSSSEYPSISKPMKLPSDYFGGELISKVGANNTHSIFITRGEKVYVAGSDSNGCCGGIKSSSVPLLLTFPSQFTCIDVSCGYDDTKFLTREGKVLGCGCGSHGEEVIDTKSGKTTRLKYQFQLTGDSNKNKIIKISNGYFCQSYQTSDLVVHNGGASPIQDEFLENFNSSDYDIYVSKQFNPKTKGFGFIKKFDGTDLTGGFQFRDLAEKVGIAGQRNHFIIHTYREDYNPILKHFIFFTKLMRMERNALSDITIFH